MQKIIITLGLVAAMLTLNACNTFQGLGKDIKKGGEKLEKTADQKKHEIK